MLPWRIQKRHIGNLSQLLSRLVVFWTAVTRLPLDLFSMFTGRVRVVFRCCHSPNCHFVRLRESIIDYSWQSYHYYCSWLHDRTSTCTSIGFPWSLTIFWRWMLNSIRLYPSYLCTSSHCCISHQHSGLIRQPISLFGWSQLHYRSTSTHSLVSFSECWFGWELVGSASKFGVILDAIKMNIFWGCWSRVTMAILVEWREMWFWSLIAAWSSDIKP